MKSSVNRHPELDSGSRFRNKFGMTILLVTCYLLLVTSPVYASVDLKTEFGYGYIGSLGEGLTKLVPATFSIATTLVIFYFLIGAFKLLTSAGDKEAVASARGMITHAIIGFIILMFVFLIFQFLLSSLFGITDLKIIKGA